MWRRTVDFAPDFLSFPAPTSVTVNGITYPSDGPAFVAAEAASIIVDPDSPGYAAVRRELTGLHRLAFDAACAHARMAIEVLDLTAANRDRRRVRWLSTEINCQHGSAIVGAVLADLIRASAGPVRIGGAEESSAHAAAFAGANSVALEIRSGRRPTATRQDFERVLLLLQAEALHACPAPA